MSIYFVGDWCLETKFYQSILQSSQPDNNFSTSQVTAEILLLLLPHVDIHDTLVVVCLTDVNLSCLERLCKLVCNRDAVIAYLSQYQITSVPSSVITVRTSEEGQSIQEISTNVDHLVSILQKPQSTNDIGEIEQMFQYAIENFNSYNLVEAVKQFLGILEVDSNHIDSLFNLASIFHMVGYAILSIPYLEKILVLSPNDATTQAFLWAIAQIEDCRALCIQTYQRLADRGDLACSHKLATLTGKGERSIYGDPNYAKQIYDHMAESFETKLVDSLDYSAPWKFKEIILNYLSQPPSNWRMLDLGCGSGLCGRILFSFSCRESDEARVIIGSEIVEEIQEFSHVYAESQGPVIVGVDVSSKIIQIAASFHAYDLLVVSDLTKILQIISTSQNEKFDLVTAADTFIYVGALSRVFSLVRQCLQANGLFAFSTEDLDTSPMKSNIYRESPSSVDTTAVVFDEGDEPIGAIPGWGAQLLQSARFGHSKHYIEILAFKYNFSIERSEKIVLRLESTVPIMGILYLLKLN